MVEHLDTPGVPPLSRSGRWVRRILWGVAIWGAGLVAAGIGLSAWVQHLDIAGLPPSDPKTSFYWPGVVLASGRMIGLYLLVLLYLLPSIVASARRHPYVGTLFLANLFAAWTLLLWLVFLAAAIWRPSEAFRSRVAALGRVGRLEVQAGFAAAPSALDAKLAAREAELRERLAK